MQHSVKTGGIRHSNTGPSDKSALSLSDYIRSVYKTEQGNSVEAEELKRKLLDSDPELARLDTLIGIDPKDIESRKTLAAAYLRGGLPWSAYQLFNEIKAVAPGNFEADLGLGRIWDTWGDYIQARQYANAAIEINPQSADAYELMGKIQLHRNALNEAVTSFKQALQLAPDVPVVLANLGYAYMLTKNLTEAKAAFEKALSLDSGLVEARNNLGIVLGEMGDPHAALAQMQQVGSPEVALNNLGALYLFQKKPVEAMQAFQEALKYDPGYTKAQENLSVARSLVPPPVIVNLPSFETSSVETKRSAIVPFLKAPEPETSAVRGALVPAPVIVNLPSFSSNATLLSLSHPESVEAPLPPVTPSPLLKASEPVPMPPIEPLAEIPRALDLRKMFAARDVRVPLLRPSSRVLNIAEPVLTRPIEPNAEIPRFALDLQKAVAARDVHVPLNASPSRALSIAEPAPQLPIEPSVVVPNISLKPRPAASRQASAPAVVRQVPQLDAAASTERQADPEAPKVSHDDAADAPKPIEATAEQTRTDWSRVLSSAGANRVMIYVLLAILGVALLTRAISRSGLARANAIRVVPRNISRD
jgi:tetratricopeptide (TPR) repeat protein